MEKKRMAPLVASRTKKDIMDTWGIDQSLWDRYEKHPDLNGGVLDFEKPKESCPRTSKFSDILEKVTKYSTMDVGASLDEEYAYDKGFHHVGSTFVGGSTNKGGSAYIGEDKLAVPTTAQAAKKVSLPPDKDKGKDKDKLRSTRKSSMTANAATLSSKRSLLPRNSYRMMTTTTTTTGTGRTSISQRGRKQRSSWMQTVARQKNINSEITTEKKTSTDSKSTPKATTKTVSKPDINRQKEDDDDHDDDDDDDDDDDGNIEELRKTKKVKVREKEKIWGYDWLGQPVPCPFEANPEVPHQMYWENKNHYGEVISMNLPSPHELPEEDMDPGLMKVKNIVKELFDKKQKRFKDEAMAELNEIRGRVLEIYNRYGIQWSFPDETEEERNKREARAQKKFTNKSKAEEKNAKPGGEAEDAESEHEDLNNGLRQPVLVGGMPLEDASKLTGIPPEKLLLMSEGMQDLMIWLQRKALEEEDRLRLTKEIEDSNERAVQRTQVLLEANRWLQALGIDLTNPNIDCPYNDVAQNEMHARHHSHSGVNHNIFARVSKLVAKTVIMGAYILQEYFEWCPVPPEAPEDGHNKNRMHIEGSQKTASTILRDEDGDKALAMTLTEEVKELRPPKGFYTDDELIVNAENWKIAVSSLEKQFKNAMDLTYSKIGREKVEQCKRQAFTIKRTFEQQLSIISMRGAELGELQETLKSLQLELYDVKLEHKIREDVIKEKATDSDLWGFRVKELEHTVANFLRSIQMFDMEYRAAVPKIGKKIGEAMKYTSHITNAEEAKVKEKSEMTAFNAIGTSVKELDAKMTQHLHDLQEEQRQKQVVFRNRVEAAKKKEGSGGFPPPPPPTTDYSVIEPNSPMTQSKGEGRKGSGRKGSKGKSKNYSDVDIEEGDHHWLGDATKRSTTVDFGNQSHGMLFPSINDGPNSKRGSVIMPRGIASQKSNGPESVAKTSKLPPIDMKYLDLN